MLPCPPPPRSLSFPKLRSNRTQSLSLHRCAGLARAALCRPSSAPPVRERGWPTINAWASVRNGSMLHPAKATAGPISSNLESVEISGDDFDVRHLGQREKRQKRPFNATSNHHIGIATHSKLTVCQTAQINPALTTPPPEHFHPQSISSQTFLKKSKARMRQPDQQPGPCVWVLF